MTLNCLSNSTPGAVGVGDGRARGGHRVGARPAQQLQPGAELRRPRLGARLEVERHLMQVSSTVLSLSLWSRLRSKIFSNHQHQYGIM